MCSCVCQKQNSKMKKKQNKGKRERERKIERANELQLTPFTQKSEFSAHQCLKQLTPLESSFQTRPNLVT